MRLNLESHGPLCLWPDRGQQDRHAMGTDTSDEACSGLFAPVLPVGCSKARCGAAGDPTPPWLHSQPCASYHLKVTIDVKILRLR